jgi:hypothetical protein
MAIAGDFLVATDTHMCRSATVDNARLIRWSGAAALSLSSGSQSCQLLRSWQQPDPGFDPADLAGFPPSQIC